MVADLRDGHCGPCIRLALWAILLGGALFGFEFGVWRSMQQAVFSSLKMPAMFFGVIAGSSLINVMLAHVLGARLSAIQTITCILLSLAMMTILLVAMTPILFLFVFQCSGPDEPGAVVAYRGLLVGNTSAVAFAGVAGNMRLYRLLVQLIGSRAKAWSVLGSWILTTGLVGFELSWVCSPFLARPDLPVSFLNPYAFTRNVFEYLWCAIVGALP